MKSGSNHSMDITFGEIRRAIGELTFCGAEPGVLNVCEIPFKLNKNNNINNNINNDVNNNSNTFSTGISRFQCINRSTRY